MPTTLAAVASFLHWSANGALLVVALRVILLQMSLAAGGLAPASSAGAAPGTTPSTAPGELTTLYTRIDEIDEIDEAKDEAASAIAAATGSVDGRGRVSCWIVVVMISQSVALGAALTALAYASATLASIIIAAAFLVAFVFVEQRAGASEMSVANPAYHLFVQRLAIVLLVVVTQSFLNAALLASDALRGGGAELAPTGSAAVMSLVVNVLSNGRAIVVFALFGVPRALLDASRLSDALRAGGLLPSGQPDDAGKMQPLQPFKAASALV